VKTYHFVQYVGIQVLSQDYSSRSMNFRTYLVLPMLRMHGKHAWTSPTCLHGGTGNNFFIGETNQLSVAFKHILLCLTATDN